MWRFDNVPVPQMRTPLPVAARAAVSGARPALHVAVVPRIYPLVGRARSGAVIEDVDGNLFLDFTAGIAVTATGPLPPARRWRHSDQAAKPSTCRAPTSTTSRRSSWPGASPSRPPGRRPSGLLHQQRAEALEAD